MNSVNVAQQNSLTAGSIAQSCCEVSGANRAAADNSLTGFFSNLLDTSSYPARWNCGAWTPLEGWLHIVSDVAIFLAYFAIPVALLYFVRKRKDVPFNGIFFLFAAFIVCCGTGHLLEAIIFYQPIYRIAGLLKFTTALVSWVTVLVLWRLVPQALELPALITKNEILRRSDAAKNEFLANMSHEIRTPLTAILGFADLLRDGGLSREKSAQAINSIKKSGTHLLAVINDILDLSKIEAGRLKIEHVRMSLVGLLHEVTSLFQSQAAGKNVKLVCLLLTPVPEFVISDPTRLRQILLNLVGNAVKFTEFGVVKVVVSLRDEGEHKHLTIDVDDTGPGMTDEQAEQLFAAFCQGDATVTRKHGGTGLGLVISRRLAALMSGNVTLLRTAVGRGSCFRLCLPVETAADTQLVARLDCVQFGKTSEVVEAGRLTGRILLAEDGPDNQKLIEYHLRKAGAKVSIADNGQIALALFDYANAKGEPFDLLVTDIQMPEMDGITLVRTLRRQGHSLPIIALTAHAMAEDRQKCMDAGCNDYAAKPIDRVALIAACRKWIEWYRGSAGASDPSDNVLVSQYADDPDMAPLVGEFLKNLPAKLVAMEEHRTANKIGAIVTLAHQLKGSAGGYGYPAISAAAAAVEHSCQTGHDTTQLRLAIVALNDICERAVAGSEFLARNLVEA